MQLTTQSIVYCLNHAYIVNFCSNTTHPLATGNVEVASSQIEQSLVNSGANIRTESRRKTVTR